MKVTYYIDNSSLLVIEEYFEGNFEKYSFERNLLINFTDQSIIQFYDGKFSNIPYETYGIQKWHMIGEPIESPEETIKLESGNMLQRTRTTTNTKEISTFKLLLDKKAELAEETIDFEGRKYLLFSHVSYYKDSQNYMKSLNHERECNDDDRKFFNSKVDFFMNSGIDKK